MGGQFTCRYCGAVKVTSPPFGIPGQLPRAPQVFDPSSTARQSGKPTFAIAVISITSVVAPLLVAILGALTLRGVRDTPPAVVGAPWLDSRACLLADVTGDGVREIGALVGRGLDESVHLALLDGATGEIVWEGTPTERADKELLCLAPNHLGVVDQRAFELTLVPTSGPAGAVRRTLSDELIQFGFDGRCLNLQTKDERSTGVAVADGSEVACPVPARIRAAHDEENTSGFRHGIISVIEQPFVVERGNARYALRTRKPGTPFLEVDAHRADTPLWTQRLSYVPAAGEAIGYLAATTAPNVVVVLGSPRDHRQEVTAVALDASTGAEQWKVPLPRAIVARVRGLFFNGRYIIVALDQSLTAIDPGSGHVDWQLAR